MCLVGFWHFSDVFLNINGNVYGHSKEEHRHRVVPSSPHIAASDCQHDLSDAGFDRTWLRPCLLISSLELPAPFLRRTVKDLPEPWLPRQCSFLSFPPRSVWPPGCLLHTLFTVPLHFAGQFYSRLGLWELLQPFHTCPSGSAFFGSFALGSGLMFLVCHNSLVLQ